MPLKWLSEYVLQQTQIIKFTIIRLCRIPSIAVSMLLFARGGSSNLNGLFMI